MGFRYGVKAWPWLAATVLTSVLIGLLGLLAPSANARATDDGMPRPDSGKGVHGRARVLMLGDSISLGYTPVVKRLLADRVVVDRIFGKDGKPLNNLSSLVARAKLDRWIEEIKRRESIDHWDIIYFNFGLHDLMFIGARGVAVPRSRAEKQAVPPWRYEQNLRWLLGRFGELAAKTIFATTTPGIEAGKMDEDQVELYNFVAKRLMRRAGIEVDDLFAAIRPKTKELQHPGDVHFGKAGYELLGRRVAATIDAALTEAETESRDSGG